MKILIVDDEKGIRTSLKFFVKGEGYKVSTADSGEVAIEEFKKFGPQIVLLDINLPGIDGIEVLQEIKKQNPQVVVIMITYLSEIKMAVNAMKLGAFDYMLKPFAMSDIKDAIVLAEEYISAKEQLECVKESEDGGFVGESVEVKALKDKVKKLMDVQMSTTIFISGESGTGKEVLSKYIHLIKSGKDKPYVAINCAAIPENLQESELFGYEKGAFTEAKGRKIGLMEQANGGTLFLDEIGDMNLELQAKLLRVIQEKSFRRVGGLSEISFEATVISATNKDLRHEIQKGNFREDLFYRLNVIPLKLPSLSQRKSDIPILIDSFVKEYNSRLKKSVVGFEKDALDKMVDYKWHGNIRELKNTIERIMIFQDRQLIGIGDIPEEILSDFYQEEKEFIGETLNSAESDVILKALNMNKWNISRAAEELGISRITLRKKIEKYSLRD